MSCTAQASRADIQKPRLKTSVAFLWFFTDLSGGKLDKRVDSRKLQNVHLMLRYARVMMSSLVIVNAIQVFLVVATIACGLLLRRSNRKLHEQLQAARQQPLQD